MTRSKIAMWFLLTALACALHLWSAAVALMRAQDKDDNADLHSKGPNPYYDLIRFGLYTGTGGAITCSTTAGSRIANCPGGTGDFSVGQGIEIPLAGVTPTFNPWGVTNISNYSRSSNVATCTYYNTTFGAGQTITITGLADPAFNGNFTVRDNTGDFYTFTTPNTGTNLGSTAGTGTAKLTSPAVVVTPSGILNGRSTYNYKVVLRGYHGELSVASPAGTTTVGAASLGVNTINISSCTRTSGLTTCTTTAAHNFQNSVPVNVLNESDPSMNGAFTIASIPSSTTFTYYQIGAFDSSSTTGTASVVAKNTVQWNMQQATTLQSIIYRSKNGGAYSIAGIGEGMDGAWVDWGLGAPPVPGYVPSTPPRSTTNGILATTITAISGTTLTLAVNATATATNKTAQHDNTPVVLAGCAAMPPTGGGTLLIPALNPYPTAALPFNSPLDFRNCNVSQLTLEIGSPIALYDPIIFKPSGLTIKGRPGSQSTGAQFTSDFTTTVSGPAYPLFYFQPGSFGPSIVENLGMECNYPLQSCVLQDQDAGGGGVANISYNNDVFSGNTGSMPFVMRSGGFNFWFEKGLFQVTSGGWGVPEALTITCNHGLGIQAGAFGQTISGIIAFDKTQFGGQGILFESWGLSNFITGAQHVTFNEALIENAYTPIVRYDLLSLSVFDTTFTNLTYADPRSGGGTPLIDVTNATGGLGSILVNNASCATGYQPVFEGAAVGGVEINNGCGIVGLPGYIQHNLITGIPPNYIFNDASLQVNGSAGGIFTSMNAAAAPTTVVSSGGSIAVGTHTYQILAVDTFGGTTMLGPGVSVTTTSGNQTVTVTPPVLPAGAVGWRPYVDGARANYTGCSFAPPAALSSSQSYIDTTGGTCGNNYYPFTNTAGSSVLSTSGVATYNLALVGGGFTDTVTGKFTTNHTANFPDVTGIIPVTSYQNSSYDNFKRANGAIDGNWTVTDGGFNVSSNAVVGTGSVNVADWSANAFSNVQFAQVAVASLNGTTDFVGVQVLTSPSGNGYTCLENSTTLLLQKMTAFSGANLTSSTSAGAAGDILRLEVTAAGVLACSRTAGGTSTRITASDTSYTNGSPGVEQFGSVATMDNWSGGNLHPIAQFDAEQDWTKTQHFGQGVAIASETLSASPRAEQNIFLPGALTSTWIASTWTTDKAITVTRVQVQAKTRPVGCGSNAVVRLTDGTTSVNLTILGAANDTGSISQNYAAGASLQLVVQTAAAGCATSPADANVVVQYRMQ